MDRDSLRNRYKRRDYTQTSRRPVASPPQRGGYDKRPPGKSPEEAFWAVLPPEQLPLPGVKRILAILITLFKLLFDRFIKPISKRQLFIGAVFVMILLYSSAHLPFKDKGASDKANSAFTESGSTANSNIPPSTLKPSTGVPKFTTYYPSALPKPMAVNRSSVRYASDSFNFTVSYSDNPLFFISEKSVAEDFSLSYFNNRLQDIKSTSYFIGDAVTGKDGIDSKTAILTKDRTLIVISCDGSYYCTSQYDTLARSLQINADSSMFDKQR